MKKLLAVALVVLFAVGLTMAQDQTAQKAKVSSDTTAVGMAKAGCCMQAKSEAKASCCANSKNCQNMKDCPMMKGGATGAKATESSKSMTSKTTKSATTKTAEAVTK